MNFNLFFFKSFAMFLFNAKEIITLTNSYDSLMVIVAFVNQNFLVL